MYNETSLIFPRILRNFPKQKKYPTKAEIFSLFFRLSYKKKQNLQPAMFAFQPLKFESPAKVNSTLLVASSRSSSILAPRPIRAECLQILRLECSA